MNQTTGRLSFAQVEEELKEQLGRSPTRLEMFDACYADPDCNPSNDEVGDALTQMKEHQSKLPPGSQDSIVPNDSFAKVRGKDPPGKVCMLGVGANLSDTWGDIPSCNTCYRMALENQEAILRMEEKMDRSNKLIAELQETVRLQQKPNNVPTTRSPISTGQSSNSINLEHRLQVGGSVRLKSMFDSGKIVAKCCLRSVDPNHDVGGKRLGLLWCEVQVLVPIEWDEDLIRPYSNLSTIGDAIGTSIAWPRHLVIADDQD